LAARVRRALAFPVEVVLRDPMVWPSADLEQLSPEAMHQVPSERVVLPARDRGRVRLAAPPSPVLRAVTVVAAAAPAEQAEVRREQPLLVQVLQGAR
jgi:hypothetical protein